MINHGLPIVTNSPRRAAPTALSRVHHRSPRDYSTRHHSVDTTGSRACIGLVAALTCAFVVLLCRLSLLSFTICFTLLPAHSRLPVPVAILILPCIQTGWGVLLVEYNASTDWAIHPSFCALPFARLRPPGPLASCPTRLYPAALPPRLVSLRSRRSDHGAHTPLQATWIVLDRIRDAVV